MREMESMEESEKPKALASGKSEEALERLEGKSKEPGNRARQEQKRKIRAALALGAVCAAVGGGVWLAGSENSQPESAAQKGGKPAERQEAPGTPWGKERLESELDERKQPEKPNPEAAAAVGKIKSAGLPSKPVSFEKAKPEKKKGGDPKKTPEQALAEAIQRSGEKEAGAFLIEKGVAKDSGGKELENVAKARSAGVEIEASKKGGAFAGLPMPQGSIEGIERGRARDAETEKAEKAALRALFGPPPGWDGNPNTWKPKEGVPFDPEWLPKNPQGMAGPPATEAGGPNGGPAAP